MAPVTMVDTDKIVSLSSGHLECRACGAGTHWCEHIETAVKLGLDSPDIWMNADLTGTTIWVPVVPSLGQWAHIVFGDEFHGNYKMNLMVPGVIKTTATGNTITRTEPEFLGFLSPGEGRNTLRQMVLDWFNPRVDEKSECQSTSHSFLAQVEWEKSIRRDNKTRLAQLWSVFTTSMCLTCSAALNAVSGDDLVPDASAPRSPWTRTR